MFNLVKSYFRLMFVWKSLPVINWVKAANHYKKGNFNLAAKFYKKSLNLVNHPAYTSAHNDYVNSLYLSNQISECKEYLLKLNKKSLDDYKILSKIYRINNDLVKEQECLKIIVNSSIKDSEVVSRLIINYVDLGDFQSLVKFKSILKHSNKDFNINLCLTYWNYVINPTLNCRAILANLVADPDATSEAHMIFGKILLAENRFDNAKNHFIKAIKMGDVLGYLYSSKALMMSANKEELGTALDFAKEANRLTSWKNLEALELIAIIYKVMDDKITAKMIAELAIEISKINGCQNYKLNQLYSSLKQENI